MQKLPSTASADDNFSPSNARTANERFVSKLFPSPFQSESCATRRPLMSRNATLHRKVRIRVTSTVSFNEDSIHLPCLPDSQKAVHAEAPFKRQCHSSGHGSSHLAVAGKLVCLNLSSPFHPASSL